MLKWTPHIKGGHNIILDVSVLLSNKSIMDIKKEIQILLRKFFDDWDDDRIGWISQANVFNLDKLLWNYHKILAKELNIQTNRSWRFMELTQKNPLHQFVRDAIEILTEVAKYDRRLTYIASEILIDSYAQYLLEFLQSLGE